MHSNVKLIYKFFSTNIIVSQTNGMLYEANKLYLIAMDILTIFIILINMLYFIVLRKTDFKESDSAKFYNLLAQVVYF